MKVRNSKNKIVQRILSLCLAITIVLGIAIGTIVPAFAAPTMDMMVTDDGNMLSAVEEASIEDALFNINQQTGIEFAVYTIESLDGTDIEAKANDLFRQLGLGEEENDNGLLLLISRDDREFRLEVGYGLEGCITDTQAMQAINVMTPYFRAEQYANGVRAAIIKIVDVLNQDGEYSITLEWQMPEEPVTETSSQSNFSFADILKAIWNFGLANIIAIGIVLYGIWRLLLKPLFTPLFHRLEEWDAERTRKAYQNSQNHQSEPYSNDYDSYDYSWSSSDSDDDSGSWGGGSSGGGGASGGW